MSPDFADNPTAPTQPIADVADRRSSVWDIRNAPKNYIWLVLFQGVSALFSFASVWLLTQYLGSEGYGGIVAIIAASQVAQVLVNWTSVAVVRFGVDEFIETEKIARTFWLRFFILLPNLLLGWVASWLWFPLLAEWLHLPPETYFLIILHFVATALWIHFQFSFQAVKMLRLQGGLMTVERILIFGGLLILLAVETFVPFWVMLCYAAVPLAMCLVGGSFLRSFVFAPFSADWIFWRKILVFSLPLIPFAFAGYLSGSYLNAIFISSFLSTSDLGIYSVATQITGIALQLPTLANSLLLPLFVSLQREGGQVKLNRYFRHALPTAILFWGLLSTAVALVLYFLIRLIFGSGFAGSATPLWILLAGTTLSLPVLLGYGSVSNATSTTYISMFGATLAAVANIVLSFMLIPVFGLEGSAWATTGMFFTSSLTYFLLVRRVMPIPISWAYLAVIPSIGGSISISIVANPWLAGITCLILTLLVAYFYRPSITETIRFLGTFRR